MQTAIQIAWLSTAASLRLTAVIVAAHPLVARQSVGTAVAVNPMVQSPTALKTKPMVIPIILRVKREQRPPPLNTVPNTVRDVKLWFGSITAAAQSQSMVAL